MSKSTVPIIAAESFKFNTDCLMYFTVLLSVSTGALYRFNLGLRGMIGGGIVGALLG